MKKLLAMAIPLAFITTQLQAAETGWEIDRAHSSVGFEVRHLGLSKVRGEFKEFDGAVKANAKTGKLSMVEGTVKVNTIDTGNEKRDGHLKADDFFAAEQYPEVKLKSRSFKWKGNKFTVIADVTMRNVTKTVKFTGEKLGLHKVNMGQGDQLRVGYTAEAELNRQDFGLKFGAMAEGVAVVGDKVKIQLDMELMRPLKEGEKVSLR